MSKTITLLKAAQVPLRGPIRPSGFTAMVDDETFRALSARGLIAEDDSADVEGKEPEPWEDAEGTGDPESEDDPEGEEGKEPEPEPVSAPVKKSSSQLPPMTASLAVWKETADNIGIKTANMKKPEIIGAVKAHLNK